MYDHKEIDNTKRIQNLYIWPIHIEIFNNFDTQIVNNLNSKRDIAFMTPTYPNKRACNSKLIQASRLSHITFTAQIVRNSDGKLLKAWFWPYILFTNDLMQIW